MKYALSSAFMMQWGRREDEGRSVERKEKWEREGGLSYHIGSFVAGFLCVGAGELSASCTRHD